VDARGLLVTIPKRPPLGGKSFWRFAWEIGYKWNKAIEATSKG
jgi:hypothetical protein